MASPFASVDWQALFVPGSPLVDTLVRGTCTYLGLLVLLRVVLKREAGTVGITDLLTVVLIADAAQNGMSHGHRSVTDGLLLVGTILFWNVSLNWAGYRFPAFGRLLRPAPLPLVERGRILRHNMRREFLTEDELWGSLREQGVESLDGVKVAYMEGNGKITVLREPPDGRG
jgi:uncharacterized membrane protein YcaP (DUF421 family)